ncbi:hypothetical protein PF008_g20888 [Phytophthora fragariae]|uniref:EGF-like domain-containing protein n=1 Tax=Phytophthora fragariae TaxID=53985 RepID=A0A6G0QY77_9STRA|nr:hypothetical protein PF008_g20888 [Phytophthora fragariae]
MASDFEEGVLDDVDAICGWGGADFDDELLGRGWRRASHQAPAKGGIKRKPEKVLASSSSGAALGKAQQQQQEMTGLSPDKRLRAVDGISEKKDRSPVLRKPKRRQPREIKEPQQQIIAKPSPRTTSILEENAAIAALGRQRRMKVVAAAMAANVPRKQGIASVVSASFEGGSDDEHTDSDSQRRRSDDLVPSSAPQNQQAKLPRVIEPSTAPARPIDPPKKVHPPLPLPLLSINPNAGGNETRLSGKDDTGFGGATCASRLCPMGAAWVDRAGGIDLAHQPAECSAMGRCDRATGTCTCESGFEGLACERLACPNACSGNGRCLSMRDAATLHDDRHFYASTTYTLWDADKIMGCQCDPGFTGMDCSMRMCPRGDDPLTTGQVNAVQTITCTCNSCTGTFALSFRGRVTANLASTATSSDLETALEALDNIYGVTVVAAAPLCSSGGASTSITFTNNPGNLPNLQVLNNLSNGGTVTVSTTTVGTRENVYCSNRGICDFSTGVCKCFAGVFSGDGALAASAGPRGDCGYQTGASVCPSTTNGVCDGKGTCSGTPSFVCTCNAGFTGFDCSLRSCPKGAAWFDAPTAPNTAHALTQCSGRGSCSTSTGVCTCLAPFTGAACDLLKCPAGTSTVTGASCSGRGTCKSMQQLSAEATDPQGNPLGVTYGATPNTLATWDALKIQGCDCETNDYFGPYENAFGDFTGGHDCYARMCPRGADPFEVGKVNEKQTLTCTADGGQFTLTFRGETTAVIPFNAGTAQVQSTLQAIDSVRTATITFDSGTTVCSTTGVVTTIEFTFMQGDVPPLGFDASALTLTSATASLAVAELAKGSKANIECSARGVCDRTTGSCACFPYFLSSDGAGNLGRRGDCGYISPYPSVTLS